MANVILKDVQKSFGNVHVLSDISLSIHSGEFVVFVGPSGCGKSTLLRMIAGLEEINEGTLEIDGKLVNNTAASKREVAMVFQSYALYPHMSVYQNLSFSLRLAKLNTQEIDVRVRKAAETLQLTEYLERYPKALSGGQRQRVAIGRAIVRDPKVFLFDEPLSNLDAALRGKTRIEIARLHKQFKATMIYVTHDQVEAMTLADRIVVLNKGKIVQVGTPLELYNTPENTFVAGFIGTPAMNILPLTHVPSLAQVPQGAVSVGIRPEHLTVTQTQADALLQGVLEVKENLGEHIVGHLSLSHGDSCIVKVFDDLQLQIGQTVFFAADGHRLHFFDANGKRIK